MPSKAPRMKRRRTSQGWYGEISYSCLFDLTPQNYAFFYLLEVSVADLHRILIVFPFGLFFLHAIGSRSFVKRPKENHHGVVENELCRLRIVGSIRRRRPQSQASGQLFSWPFFVGLWS